MTTATDFFCGMGGSSSGLAEAGFEIKVAANHWPVAIESHSANHPNTEHLCADISNIDLRYLPKTDILWASPICTELSPAGGRRKKGSQLDLFEQHGHVASEAFERTRVTFWEVIRAVEIHRYNVVLIENVIEAAQWELFDVWLSGMAALGYQHQFVSINAAHASNDGNDPAAQWRDRLYIAFWREGITMPDLTPTPLAWCDGCGDDIEAVQWWKKSGRRIGKYGQQYLYACPRHGRVEPYVAPASTVIDWSDLGTRIGDREELGMKPLHPATIKRIEHGLRIFGDSALVANGGNTWDAASGVTASGKGRTKVPENYIRAWPLDGSPTPAQVTAIQNGLALSPRFVMGVNHGGSDGRPFDPDAAPLPTRSTKNGEGIVTAPFVAMLRNNVKPTGMDQPLRTFATARHHGLVVPYRKGAKPHRADARPISTLATREQHGLMQAAVDVEDCRFRMLDPREAANAQRFARDYVIHGNKGERQMQAGNAVAVNVAHYLGAKVMSVLAGAA